MTTTHESPAPSTTDLRAEIALALAEHDGEDAATGFRVGAAEAYWLEAADAALAVIQPVLAAKDAELEQLRAQVDYARAQRDYAFDQLPQQPAVPEWREGAREPGPDVQAVRGRTGRMYQRETNGRGTRWMNRASGSWFTWPNLLQYELHVRRVDLGGTR